MMQDREAVPRRFSDSEQDANAFGDQPHGLEESNEGTSDTPSVSRDEQETGAEQNWSIGLDSASTPQFSSDAHNSSARRQRTYRTRQLDETTPVIPVS